MADTKTDDIDLNTPIERFVRPGYLVRRLHQICISVFLETARDLNLTSVQYAILVGIEIYPGIDQMSLGKLVALDRQTVSNVVSRLHTRGLVDKLDKNKRTKALFLTEPGREVIAAMDGRTQGVDATILAPLAADEQDQFMALLLKVVSKNNMLSRAPIDTEKVRNKLDEIDQSTAAGARQASSH